MKKIVHKVMILICITIILSATACSKKSTTEAEGAKITKPVTITMFAAGNLKTPMEEIKRLYAEEKNNVTINFSFAAAGMLQQQIENGASVDIFMPAATKQMNALQEKDLIIKDTRKNLLGNSVVLVVKNDVTGITDFKDSATDKIKKLALGEPKVVPAGQYAEDIYKSLNIFDQVKPKVVYAKDVMEVLAWVESGNVDAGVVYGTDAKASTKLKAVAVAPKELLKTPVVYPAAVIKASKNVNEAKEFLEFLSGSKAKTVFEKYGFEFLIK